jgi:FKBP-type peptidyl-prolyl cis-trans isomerase FkpA
VLRALTPLTCLLALFTLACSSTPPPPGQSEITTLVSEDKRVGDGAEATWGREVLIHYDGHLYDRTRPENRGREFDSSRDRNEPFAFTLGKGEVIKGWEEGVNGMKVGGKRTLTIPPSMAYGSQGFETLIPPNATLIFEVELIDVK